MQVGKLLFWYIINTVGSRCNVEKGPIFAIGSMQTPNTPIFQSSQSSIHVPHDNEEVVVSIMTADSPPSTSAPPPSQKPASPDPSS